MKPFLMPLLVLGLFGGGLLSGESAHAAVFTVNSNRDDNDGSCQALPDGDCTLREAINAANRVATTDTINFAIPVLPPQIISPSSALPVITSPVIINGYSQPQTSQNTLASGNNAVITVILDGITVDGRTNNITGLDLRGGNSTVTGLNIRRYRTGISLPSGGSNIIRGNFLNVNTTGLSINSSNNTIGGTAAANRNVISSNTTGVNINSSATPSTASGNVVQGNYIGTNFNGSASAGNTTGLLLSNASGNFIGGTVSGARNVISGNSGDGIGITGSASTGNKIEGNFIGTNLSASAALANGGNGVGIINASSSNIIGGTTAAARNIISGNRRSGIIISGTTTTGNVVQGNFIGTNATASAAIANNLDGVVLFSTPGNVIGGTTTGARNIISGNTGNGVTISEVTTTTNAAANNLVQGNFIGTNLAGSAALANGGNGVSVTSGARRNTIGGSAVAAGNIISGNRGNGIVISSATLNRVEGNFIGTDANGTVSLGNSDGIVLGNAASNVVGVTFISNDTTTGARNLISGNRGRGISIFGVGAVGNLVRGNFIGTNAAGSAALANSGHGVHLFNGANSNEIGGGITDVNGSPVDPRNIISGNGGDGVRITGTSTQNTTANNVLRNVIGLDVTGTLAIPNNQNGLTLDNAGPITNSVNLKNTVSRNTISGNTLNGILISSTFPTFQNEIGPFNNIGTNAQATAAVGNGANGILVQNASNVTITGSNIIAGNPLNGVLLEASSCDLDSNRIGITTASGVEIVNGGHGVLARNGGGVNLRFSNSITLNRGDGVRIESGSTVNVDSGNSISNNIGHGISFDGVTNSTIGFGTASPNRIFSNGGDGVFVASNCTGIKINNANLFSGNGGLAIDLAPDGPTPNDPGDLDTGANQLQNSPVFDVSDNPNGIPIRGTLNSKPNTAYTIDLWESTTPDPSGFGEGDRLLGSVPVTTGPDGNGAFDTTALPFAQRLEGRFVTATATDPQRNTSEFSRVIQIPTVDMTLTVTASPEPVTAGEILTYTLRATNNGPVTRQAQISNILPAGVPLDSPPQSDQGTPVVSGQVASGQRVTVNFGPLEPGGTVTVIIRVRPPVSATIRNTATLSGNFVDNNPADNTVTTVTTVLPRVDLSLTGTAPTSIDAGETLTYTLKVKNLGRRDATSVSLINQLPEGVEFLGATPAATSQAGRVLTFNLGPLAVDAERTIAIRVRPTTGGRLINVARVFLGAGQGDPDATNNAVALFTTVTGCARDAGNQVTITRGPIQLSNFAECFFGGACRLRQVVTVKNTGTTSLAGPLSLVLDNLGSGITLHNASGTTSCNAPLGSPYVQISPTSLAPGASVDVTLEFETSGNDNVTYDPRVLYGQGER